MRTRLLAILIAALAAGCTRSSSPPPASPPASADPALQTTFTDDFERSELGPTGTTPVGRTGFEGGRLVFARVHNHPLWLKRRLPDDVRIEFDCLSKSPDGDIKVEVAGDGKTFQSDQDVARDLIYTASGYVFIFGGWSNSRSVLIRQDEHEWQHRAGVPQRTSPRVEPGRSYHWTLEKKGTHLTWKLDGQTFLERDDPNPLAGPGHDRFGFNGWETEVSCDHLKIEPL
ncbi:MAG: hypothetical protein QM765_34375 [Myxococcales bacterium]